MGYETKIFISMDCSTGDGAFYPDATLKLSKIGECNFSRLIENKSTKKNKHYYYEGVNEKGESIKINEDCYGAPIVKLKITEALKALKKDYEESKEEYPEIGYRRFEAAVALLEVFNNRFKGESFYVYTYGY